MKSNMIPTNRKYDIKTKSEDNDIDHNQDAKIKKDIKCDIPTNRKSDMILMKALNEEIKNEKIIYDIKAKNEDTNIDYKYDAKIKNDDIDNKCE